MTWLLLGLCGGLGALGRFELARFISSRSRGTFPWGTLVVNVSGSIAAGFSAGLDLEPTPAWLVTTGVLGGFTTFSTWMVEAAELGAGPSPRLAGLNVALMLALGLAGVAAGSMLAG
ncbi:MAG: CrcB family protein [Acidimicrobiia bacterium]|nr:CrcB family protein [Acidimicrobiia bacterium]MDH4308904.1 CrcB family protein [Acidimicrobiia bacterium]